MNTSENHVADVILKALLAEGGSIASFKLKAIAISHHLDVFLLTKTQQQLLDLGFIRKGASDTGKGRHLIHLTDIGRQAASTSLLDFLQANDQ
jgi:hypothetical protein